ncbi:hypothetical protein VI817_002390 [Penicillium citrinum]|uniref:Uncharacterized protein n=1 Tax=Penicillium hetheringtonii TaxID=911720 RepID=A0AAD6GWU6_9EURO|nr:hypothetical protein N7450_004986 [Penicillium hetheringtonii]KAK5800178.1 hypothetical protein VI817_002390 [Penicillium citrinum]
MTLYPNYLDTHGRANPAERSDNTVLTLNLLQPEFSLSDISSGAIVVSLPDYRFAHAPETCGHAR